MRDVPHLFGDCRGLNEKLVPCGFREHGARPFDVDDCVDDDVSDVYSSRSEIARHRFGQDPLRGLGRREAGELLLSTKADVFPVTMMAPSPASIIAGAIRRARWRSAIVFT